MGGCFKWMPRLFDCANRIQLESELVS
jgi:hypothetical protein